MLPGFIYIPSGIVDEEVLYYRNRVTDTYPRGHKVDSPAIALVVQDRELQAVGLLERGDSVTSFERRIAIENVHLLSQYHAVSSIVAEIPVRVRRFADETFHTGGPVSAATWRELRLVLDRSPELREIMSSLEARVSPPRWVADTDAWSRTVLQHEQDALGLALSSSGVGRDALRSWRPQDSPSPFLAGLEHVELREDQLLAQDMLVFGQWDRTNANGLWAEFSDTKGNSLVVMNVNRAALELTLGVDLIYYSGRHQAFTLVQYKRMRWETGGRKPVYRPAHDKNILQQIERMRILEEGVDSQPALSVADYRLARTPCFLKVCHPTLELGTPQLSKGMYMDLELWDLVTAELSEKERNPSIAFDKGIRYLDNSKFISLVGQGWIGSRGVTTAAVERYISEALQGNESVTLAVERS